MMQVWQSCPPCPRTTSHPWSSVVSGADRPLATCGLEWDQSQQDTCNAK